MLLEQYRFVEAKKESLFQYENKLKQDEEEEKQF
jgi:hypothetical protein